MYVDKYIHIHIYIHHYIAYYCISPLTKSNMNRKPVLNPTNSFFSGFWVPGLEPELDSTKPSDRLIYWIWICN